jgi:hypothetical protein
MKPILAVFDTCARIAAIALVAAACRPGNPFPGRWESATADPDDRCPWEAIVFIDDSTGALYVCPELRIGSPLRPQFDLFSYRRGHGGTLLLTYRRTGAEEYHMLFRAVFPTPNTLLLFEARADEPLQRFNRVR